ncbi:MAG: hypothetical protein MJZ50_07575 [Treponema sp.]|nr:hypothetical protein [Treponema sp.]
MTYKKYFNDRIKKENEHLSDKTDLAIDPKQFKDDTFYPFLRKLGILKEYKRYFDSKLELNNETKEFLDQLFNFIFRIPDENAIKSLLADDGKEYNGGRGMGQKSNAFYCRAILNDEEKIIQHVRSELLEILEKFEGLIKRKNSNYSLNTNEYYCDLFKLEKLEELKKLDPIDFKILFDLCINTPLKEIEQARDLPIGLVDPNDFSKTLNFILSVANAQTVLTKDIKFKSMQKQLSDLEKQPARRNNYRKIDKKKDELNNYVWEEYIQNSDLINIPMEKEKFHYQPSDIEGKVQLLVDLLKEYRNDRPLS